jgi:NAD(P)-dependent dehydrogenase (short-subunit alcohol dehydrogenase family)
MEGDLVGALEGKTAVVTGGASGIGAAVARRFAAEGATVAILDVQEAAAETVAKAIMDDGGAAFVERCDVSNPAETERAVSAVTERAGHVSALANCAGIYDLTNFLDIKVDSWNRVIGVDLTGTFLVSQTVARDMAQNGGGAIVCIASIDSHTAEPAYASYNAAKAAVRLMVQTAAIDLAPYNIRINSVSPGYVDTPMIDSLASPALMHHLRHEFVRVPFKRLVRPDEIAAAMLFLVSDEASGISGTDLIVDLGTLANSYVGETFPQGL